MKQTGAEDFSAKELMIVAAAREIMDRDLVFIGLGVPLAAAYLALMTHAPRSKILLESGIVDSVPMGTPISIADPRLAYRCAKSCGGFYALSLLQRGYVDVSLLGGAEVDKYGNINSIVIGDYRRPKIRLPGSGGANDAASHSKRFVILIPHERRRFPEKVSFITSPGYISGPGDRRKAGLMRGGPSRVITNLAVLGFDKWSKMMKLESIHPGVSIKEIESNTGFKLIIPKKIRTTKPPTVEQLKVLRSKIDPDGFFSREHNLQNKSS
jgi:glutaconate CoA-transferase subunit B